MNYEIKGMKDLLKGLDPKIATAVLTRSLNAITKKAMTAGNKETRGKYNIKAGDLKSYMRMKRASNNSGKLRTVVKLSSGSVAMYKFGGQSFVAKTKGAKRYFGASAKPLKTKRRTKYKGAFPAVMSNGHLGIYRESKSRRSRKTGRAAIQELRMITPTSMFEGLGSDAMYEYVDDNLLDVFFDEYKRKAWVLNR